MHPKGTDEMITIIIDGERLFARIQGIRCLYSLLTFDRSPVGHRRDRRTLLLKLDGIIGLPVSPRC